MTSHSPKDPAREVSLLELNLDKCDNYLQEAFCLEDTSSLEDIISQVHAHLKLLADVFVPANLTDDEASDLLDRLLEVKKKLRGREKDARILLDDVTQVKNSLALLFQKVILFFCLSLKVSKLRARELVQVLDHFFTL